MEILYENSSLPSNYLTLDDAIAVALDRNLDLLVKEWEGAVQRETATREHLKLLQSLTLSGELSWRNKNTGSSSQSLNPLIPPAPPSISSNQTVRRWDFTYTFNILDFGVSYFRAQQEHNKAIIQSIEYARLQNNLVLDVTRQFWKVIYAQKAIQESQALINRMIAQRESIRSEVAARFISEMPALKAEDQLLSVQIQLHAYQKEYHEGKMELARLMGYPACLEFELADLDTFEINAEVSDPCALSEIALLNRPELFSLDVEEKIGVNEAYAAIVQLFPALAPFSGANFDGNTFLINNFWLIAGVRAAWNLFAIPQHIAEMRIGIEDQMTSRARRMALSIGVMSQVHLAFFLYKDNLEQFRLIEEQRNVKKQIYQTAAKQFRVGLTSGIDVLNYEADLYIAELNYLRAFSELQIALEQLNNAMGIPLKIRNTITFKKPSERGESHLKSVLEETLHREDIEKKLSQEVQDPDEFEDEFEKDEATEDLEDTAPESEKIEVPTQETINPDIEEKEAYPQQKENPQQEENFQDRYGPGIFIETGDSFTPDSHQKELPESKPERFTGLQISLKDLINNAANSFIRIIRNEKLNEMTYEFSDIAIKQNDNFIYPIDAEIQNNEISQIEEEPIIEEKEREEEIPLSIPVEGPGIFFLEE
jgi:outer membrane protein TolC